MECVNLSLIFDANWHFFFSNNFQSDGRFDFNGHHSKKLISIPWGRKWASTYFPFPLSYYGLLSFCPIPSSMVNELSLLLPHDNLWGQSLTGAALRSRETSFVILSVLLQAYSTLTLGHYHYGRGKMSLLVTLHWTGTDLTWPWSDKFTYLISWHTTSLGRR